MKKITNFHVYFAISFVLYAIPTWGVLFIDDVVFFNFMAAIFVAAYRESKH